MLAVIPTALPEVLRIRPRIFGDSRGFFFESFNARAFREATGVDLPFVQDNHSRSARGVLRGLHFQVQQPQGKLVRVVAGEVFDVAVDIRPDSPRCGQWVGVRLNAEQHEQLYVPPGFAHGFLVLSETADSLYKTTDYHAPEHERAIAWNDPDLAIDWPLELLGGTPQTPAAPTLSAKDAAAMSWRQWCDSRPAQCPAAPSLRLPADRA